jgi:hypothetical protein
MNDVTGDKAESSRNRQRRFLCTLASVDTMGQSYEVHMWRQAFVPVQRTLSEAVLEYGAATRYYLLVSELELGEK